VQNANVISIYHLSRLCLWGRNVIYYKHSMYGRVLVKSRFSVRLSSPLETYHYPHLWRIGETGDSTNTVFGERGEIGDRHHLLS